MAELKMNDFVKNVGQRVAEEIKQKYIERRVLDDIRAEITSLRNALEDYGQMDEAHALNFVLQIIDKHIADKEQTDAT